MPALMPIVARDLLHGGAQTYGVMLGAFGMGAVVGALNIATLRGRLGDEVSVCLCMVLMGDCVAVVAISRSPVLTGGALIFAGAAWTASVTLFNVGVQLAAPRWVAGRALAAYQAAIATERIPSASFQSSRTWSRGAPKSWPGWGASKRRRASVRDGRRPGNRRGLANIGKALV